MIIVETCRRYGKNQEGDILSSRVEFELLVPGHLSLTLARSALTDLQREIAEGGEEDDGVALISFPQEVIDLTGA